MKVRITSLSRFKSARLARRGVGAGLVEPTVIVLTVTGTERLALKLDSLSRSLHLAFEQAWALI